MTKYNLQDKLSRMVNTEHDAKVAARIAEIEAEAEKKKAEADLQAQLDRNGGYTDSFKEWGKEVLRDVRKKSERDNPTARVLDGLSKAKG